MTWAGSLAPGPRLFSHRFDPRFGLRVNYESVSAVCGHLVRALA